MIGKQAKLLAIYYNILEINSDASLAEVENAYRIKIEKIQPEIDSSEEAQKDFLLIQKAYRYVIGVKTGKIPLEKALRSTDTGYEYRNYKRRVHPFKSYKESYKLEKKKSAKEELDIAHIATLLPGFAIFLTLLLDLYILYFLHNSIRYTDNVAGITIIVITSPIIIISWYRIKKTPSKAQKDAYNRLAKSVSLYLVIYALLLFIGFTKFVVHTFVPAISLFLVYAGPTLFFFLALPIENKYIILRGRFVSFVIWPLFLTLFFAFNFIYSHSTTVKTFAFTQKHKSDVTVRFEKNEYYYYPQIRTFYINQAVLDDYKYVQLHIARGLFGISVVKHHQFTDDKNTQD